MFLVSGNSIAGDSEANEIIGSLFRDEIFGLEGADIISSAESADALYGNAGADSIFGQQDDDIIHGGLGSDLLFGGQGSDRIFGDEGEDTIYGDNGADTLIGGAGADVFVIGAGTGGSGPFGGDFIVDFASGEDLFELIGDLEFEDLAFTTTAEGDAAIEVESTGEVLAVLSGVDTLTRDNFLPVVDEGEEPPLSEIEIPDPPPISTQPNPINPENPTNPDNPTNPTNPDNPITNPGDELPDDG